LEQGFAPTGTFPPSMNSRWVHSMVYDPTPEQMTKAREDFARAGMLGFPTVGSMPSPPMPSAESETERACAQGAYDPLAVVPIPTRNMPSAESPYKGLLSSSAMRAVT